MPEAFEDRLRRSREEKGLSQAELAQKTGFQPSAISHFESGRRSPSFDNLKKLEKKKSQNFLEWIFTRYALETLTGQYHRDRVEDWVRWWDVMKDRFSIEKRVAEEKEKK